MNHLLGLGRGPLDKEGCDGCPHIRYGFCPFVEEPRRWKHPCFFRTTVPVKKLNEETGQWEYDPDALPPGKKAETPRMQVTVEEY